MLTDQHKQDLHANLDELISYVEKDNAALYMLTVADNDNDAFAAHLSNFNSSTVDDFQAAMTLITKSLEHFHAKGEGVSLDEVRAHWIEHIDDVITELRSGKLKTSYNQTHADSVSVH